MGLFAIVVIGYNRPESIRRILNRLIKCNYEGDRVDLIVSLDNCGNNDCEKLCRRSEWPYGQMKVRTFENRQGLKKHILSCGDILLDGEYDAIAVFEDDIYPAESFYTYMKQVYKAYEQFDNIAGFSLYSPSYMTSTDVSFTPQLTMYDVYFMQVAQSWGQVWTRRHWVGFKEWLSKQPSDWIVCDEMPIQIGNWGKNSWLKYYMRYCAETKKYFVYPYKAFATCYSEVGQHTTENSTQLQVPLINGNVKSLNLPQFNAECIRYDSFYENENVIEFLSSKFSIPPEEITIDLYGTKPCHRRYWLTTKIADYTIIESYDLNMKPHEMNVLGQIKGDRIHLYDTDLNMKKEIKKDSLSFPGLERFEYYNNCKINRNSIGEIFYQTMARSFKHFCLSLKKKLGKSR